MEADFKNLKKKDSWKKKATPQHAILILSLSELILDAPDMALETFLVLAVDKIWRECIQERVTK